MDTRLSIVVIGFDGYSDLWDDCIGLIKKFWIDCPYEIVFVNNELEKKWENVTVLHAGVEAEWSKKVQVALNYCNSRFICLLLEDFLIGDLVDAKKISNLIELMIAKNIDYIKLADMNNAAKDRCKAVPENKHIHKVRYCDDYGISLQPSIWKKEFLIEKLGQENYNAWVFEFDRVKESRPNDKGYRENVLFDTRNILNIQHGVIQGKYLPLTIKYFKKRGVNLNIKREVMKLSQYRKIRFISFCKSLIPLWLRPFVKKSLEKTGMKFVSTTRDK